MELPAGLLPSSYTCNRLPGFFPPCAPQAHLHLQTSPGRTHRRWRSSVLSWPRRRRRKWQKWAGSGERWPSHITNQTAAISRTCAAEDGRASHSTHALRAPSVATSAAHSRPGFAANTQQACRRLNKARLTTPAASKPAKSVAPWPFLSMAHTAATLVARLSTSETPMSRGPCWDMEM